MALGPGRAARKSRRPRRRRVLAARPASAEPEPARRRWRRRRKACLTFDDGPHAELTPRARACSTSTRQRRAFSRIGEKARAHPEIVRETARRGHSVENHTYRHSNFCPVRNAAAGKRDRLAQAALMEITARPSSSAPLAGLRSPLLAPVLAAMGLRHGLLDAARARQRRCQPAARARAVTSGLAAVTCCCSTMTGACARGSVPRRLDEPRRALGESVTPMHAAAPVITRYTAVNCLGAGGAALEALRAKRSGLRPANSRPPRSIPGREVPGLRGDRHARRPRGIRLPAEPLAQLGLEQDGFAAAVAAARDRYGAGRTCVFIGTSTGILETELAYRRRDPQTGALPASFRYHATLNTYSLGDFIGRYFRPERSFVRRSSACSSTASKCSATPRA